MPNQLIHDRGRGPELIGTRITVYNLLPHFLDESATEAYICRLYDLTSEQVAAARAFVLNHAGTVLARHLQIEERLAAGNPPEVIEQAQRTHNAFVKFKEFLDARDETQAVTEDKPVRENKTTANVPTFSEWMAQQESR